ncbi:hypothetical protein [Rhodococcus sp. UFZ-B548]|uniref:hypothetical protein n=1 Tax=Rhodococcus sp. UFZ-B548 TaxID=2742212 RepID=UPI0015F73476|nr:hypothetical protein [Rhodococcus sp. UFZ-B548]
MTDKPTRDDLFGPGILDDLLSFDTDGIDDTTGTDDLTLHDDPAPWWFADLTRAAGEITGERTIEMDVARGSVLGFTEDLAAVVRDEPALLSQLERHWADNGVTAIVHDLALQPTPRGRLHAQLLQAASSTTDATVTRLRPHTDRPEDSTAAVETNVGGAVIDLWTLSPHVQSRHAAASDTEFSPDSFTQDRPEWGMSYTQTPNEDGSVKLEVEFDIPRSSSTEIILVQIGDERRFLTLRPRGGSLTAGTTVRNEHAWGQNSVAISRPLSADNVPEQDRPLVTESVRRASIPEQNRWRKIQSTLEDSHPVAAAIADGLR